MLQSDFYKPGDGEKINALYNEVFGRNRSLDQWKWEFLDIPHGTSVIRVLRDGPDIVGHFALMPFRMGNKETVVVSGKSENLMLHPKYRGRKLFAEFTGESLEIAKDEGFKVAWVLTGAIPAIKAMKRAGYAEAVKFALYAYPLSSDVFCKFFTRRFGNWASAAGTVSWWVFLLFRKVGKTGIDIEECSLSEYVSFFEDKWLPQQSRFSVFRSHDFLKWKFFENPYGIQSRFVKLKCRSKTLAYAILVKRERSICIEDLMVLDENEGTLAKGYVKLENADTDSLTHLNATDLPSTLQQLRLKKDCGSLLVTDLCDDPRWLDPARWYYTRLFHETIS